MENQIMHIALDGPIFPPGVSIEAKAGGGQ